MSILDKDIEYHIIGDDKVLFERKVFTELVYRIHQLEKENEYLKLSNPEMNIEHFRIINENKRKIDNLRKQNKDLQQELKIMVKDDERSQETIIRLTKENKRLKENAIHNDKVVDKAKWNEMIYKSRCEKASKVIKNKYPVLCESEGDFKEELLNILEGENNGN